jgi:hypothetical protein
MLNTAANTPVVEQDPWKDEFTHTLQLETAEERVASLQKIADEEQFSTPAGLMPEVVRTEQSDEEFDEDEEDVPPAAPVAAVPAPAEPAEPVVSHFEDGSSFTVSRDKKGWSGVLDTGIPGATVEKFYGATKEEMYQKLAHAKVHATRKIREQNRIIKLGKPGAAAAPAQPIARTQVRALTAEESFELRTKLEADPAAALDEYFRMRTGVDLDTLVQKAQAGEAARDEMVLGDVAAAFVAKNPTYYAIPSNFWTIVGYLAKNNLNETLNEENKQALLAQLVRSSQWTVENIEDAFEDLTESGLLETKPAAPARTAEPVAPAPTPAPAAQAVPATPAPPISEREVRRTRQPRAGFGIRERESTPATPPAATQPLPVTNFDNLTDAQISELLTNVRREVRGSR